MPFSSLLKISTGDFRTHFTLILALLAILILTPFAVIDFLYGKYLVASGISVLLAGFIHSAWKIHTNNYNPSLIYWLVLPALMAVLLFAFYSMGIKAGFWLYPAVIVLYLVMPERMAVVANIVLLAVAGALAWSIVEHEVALRLIASLTAVSVFIATFIFVIVEQQEQLRQLAVTDPLTGLLNRSRLPESMEAAIAQAERADIDTTLIAIDLDYFKEINDQHGHGTGDVVLRSLATLMSERSRKTDYEFRLGGEEFLILLFNTGLEGGKHVAEDLRIAVEADRQIMTTASFGVATYHQGESTDSWLQRVDSKLYEAKDSGRNRVAA